MQGEEEDVEGKDSSHPKKVKVLNSEEATTTSIFDVVLPLPGSTIVYPGHIVGELYHQHMVQDGIDFDTLQNVSKEFTLAGDYRPLMAHAKDLEYTVLSHYDPKAPLQLTDMDLMNGRDETYLEALRGMQTTETGEQQPQVEQRALRIQFTLQTSQYATMCLRELLKEHMETATQGLTPKVPATSLEAAVVDVSAAVVAK